MKNSMDWKKTQNGTQTVYYLERESSPDWYAKVYDQHGYFKYLIGQRNNVATGRIESCENKGRGWKSASTAKKKAIGAIWMVKNQLEEKAEANKKFHDSCKP